MKGDPFTLAEALCADDTQETPLGNCPSRRARHGMQNGPHLFGLPMTAPQEPATHSPAVRRFKDPQYREVAATLGDLRSRIDALDEQIVALLAQRAQCVRDATRFKRDAFQVASPARQAQVFARVRALAQQHEHRFPGLPDVVEDTYRTLVSRFVACEGRLFDETEPLAD